MMKRFASPAMFAAQLGSVILIRTKRELCKVVCRTPAVPDGMMTQGGRCLLALSAPAALRPISDIRGDVRSSWKLPVGDTWISRQAEGRLKFAVLHQSKSAPRQWVINLAPGPTRSVLRWAWRVGVMVRISNPSGPPERSRS